MGKIVKGAVRVRRGGAVGVYQAGPAEGGALGFGPSESGYLGDHPSHPSESQSQVTGRAFRPSHGSESRQVYPFVDEIVVVQPAPAPGAPPRPDAAAAFAAWADKLTVRQMKYSIRYKLFRTCAEKFAVRVHINT